MVRAIITLIVVVVVIPVGAMTIIIGLTLIVIAVGIKVLTPFGHASILCKAELLRQLKSLIERRKRNPF